MQYSRLHSYRSYADPPRSASGGLEFGSVATVNSSIYIYIYIWVVVDIVVACLVDCWLLGDCIGKNRNTSSGQDFRIYSLKIHLQDKDIVTLHGIYSKNID